MRKVSDAWLIEVHCYRSEDAAATLTGLLKAITETAAADYSPGQIAAWARPEQRTVSEWDRAMQARYSYVALLDKVIVGFSDVDVEGHIYMMFDFTTTLASRGGLSSLHPPPRSSTSTRDSQPFSRFEHHRTRVFRKTRVHRRDPTTSHDRRRPNDELAHDKDARQRPVRAPAQAHGHRFNIRGMLVRPKI